LATTNGRRDRRTIRQLALRLGLLVITFGWIGIGFAEFAWISMVAALVRSIHGSSGHRDDDAVIIIDPDRH
jgi:hypothetical protein